MPSTSFSARRRAATGAPERPLAVPFAAGFGALTAVEVLFLGALMWLPDPRMDRVTVVTLLLVAAASAGSLMVLQGRRGGWLLLATGCRHPRPRRTCDQPSIVGRTLDGPGIGRVG